MKQVSSADYDVNSGESVTITADLLNGVTPETLQVFRNGAELTNLGGNSPRYQFTVTNPLNEVITFFCSFVGLDTNAAVTTQVQGAPNPGITLKQGQNQKDMTFSVIQSPFEAIHIDTESAAPVPAKKKKKRTTKPKRKADS